MQTARQRGSASIREEKVEGWHVRDFWVPCVGDGGEPSLVCLVVHGRPSKVAFFCQSA